MPFVIGTKTEQGVLPLATVDPLAMARAWKHANPAAYRQIVTWAMVDMEHGQRPSAKLYVELLRRPHFAHLLGFTVHPMDKQVKIRNALTADLARLIELEFPEIVFPKSRARADTWS